MKFNVTIEQAQHFVLKGEVMLVEYLGEHPNFRSVARVGSVRALCQEGKKLWWCSECKRVYPKREKSYLHATNCYSVQKPLYFMIESMERRKLLHLTRKELFGQFPEGSKISDNSDPDVWLIKGKV